MSAYRKPAEVKPLEIITEKKRMDQNELYLRAQRTWAAVVVALIFAGASVIDYVYYIEPKAIRARTDLAIVERDTAANKLAVAQHTANAEMQRAMAERAYTDRIMFETMAKSKECK